MSPSKLTRVAKGPEGFVSMEALKRLRRVSIIAGSLPILLFLAAYVAMFALAFTGGFDGKKGYAYGTVLGKDESWYLSGHDGSYGQISLRHHRPPAKDATLASFRGDLKDSFLLQDSAKGRLWIMNDEKQGYWDGQSLHWLEGVKAWDAMSRPFLWEGEPAFLSEKDGAASIWKHDQGHWKKKIALTIDGLPKENGCGCPRIRVARSEDEWHWFYLDDGKIRAYQGLPKGAAANVKHWRAITHDSANENWAPKGLARGLYLADHGQDSAIRVWKLEGRRWMPVKGDWGEGTSVALTDGDAADPTLIRSDPGITAIPLEGDGPPLKVLAAGPSNPKLFMFIPIAVLFFGFFLSPFAALFVMDRENKRARPEKIKFQRKSVRLAGLLRRAIARLLDGLLVMFFGLPLGALCAWALGLFKDLNNEPLRVLGILALIVFWLFVGELGLILLEGRSGRTPGRRALGIRVLGTDLKVCGFWRSFLRSVVTVVDGQLFWLPGILTASLSKHQQRLGDMAADTVVIQED